MTSRAWTNLLGGDLGRSESDRGYNSLNLPPPQTAGNDYYAVP